MREATATAAKVGLLGSLYFAQGLPYGFFTQALPVLLRKEGYSLGAIGLSSLLAIPWALKFVWAPLVDRYGSRRTWILAMQLATTALMAALALYTPGPESMQVLLAAVFLANLAAATQDIGTDGLAVDMLAVHERGLANGVQVGGYRLGMIAGGGALLIVFDRTGWGATFGAMALLIVLSSVPLLLARTPPSSHLPVTEAPRVVHFLRRPGAPRILLLLVSYKLGEWFATGMLRPFLTDLGLTLSDIGELVGTIGFIAALAGALSGGALVNRLGRKRALLTFGVLQALSIAGFAVIALMVDAGEKPMAAIWAVTAAEHFASGMATASLFTAMMDWSRPLASATDYTVQASTVVIATGIASSLSGFSAQALGYAGHFIAATVFAAIALVVVAWLFPRGGEFGGER